MSNADTMDILSHPLTITIVGAILAFIGWLIKLQLKTVETQAQIGAIIASILEDQKEQKVELKDTRETLNRLLRDHAAYHGHHEKGD